MALNLKTETEFADDSPAAQPPLPPEQIAPHFPQLEILECLGRGGMGVVYKARQKTLNRLVALKLLAPERVGDSQFAERFTREAQALAALSHPNIVTIHDFGQAGGFYFLLMEYVDGLNLRQLLRMRKFTPEEALTIVPPLCDALQFAHDRGIVHRDIKPENLLLDKAGHVKVADFGIAKMLGAANGGGTMGKGAPEGLTQSALGTPGYTAPEQKTDPQRVDSRADIYSLGVVFYELLTGELPGKPLQPPSRKVHIDVRLDEVVLRALEQKPELRYQQASVLKTQVETIVATPALPAGGSPRKPHWTTYFPGRTPLQYEICSHLTQGEQERMGWMLLLFGIGYGALFYALIWFKDNFRYGMENVTYGNILLFLFCLLLGWMFVWRWTSCYFLRSTAWARKSGNVFDGPTNRLQKRYFWFMSIVFGLVATGMALAFVHSQRVRSLQVQQSSDATNPRPPGASSPQTDSTSPSRAATPEQPAEPPKLRFLTWLDEWQTNKPGAARRPDGSPVTDPKEMDWLIQVRPIGLDVSPLKLSPKPRLLHLWFSHLEFDESSLNDVSLLDEHGVELPTAFLGQTAENARGAGSLQGGLGWLTKTLSPGAGTNIPRVITVRLRYTTSSIERTNLILIPGQTNNATLEEDSRIEGTGQKTDGRVFVSIAMNAGKMESREFGVVAFTQNGRKLTAAQVVRTPPDKAGTRLIEFVFDFPAVDKFIIGTRPIRTNQWQNVALPLPRAPAPAASLPDGATHEVIQLGGGFLNAVEFICNDLHLEYVIDHHLLPTLAVVPAFTNRMVNLTSRQALTRLLDRRNLQLLQNPLTGVAYITTKDIWKVVDPSSVAPAPKPPDLSLVIRCTNTVTKVGDEIPIEFLISNTGTDYYRYADRTYDRSGRMEEYKLVARTESGEVVPDPRAKYQRSWLGGGLFQYQILMPGRSFSKTIALNRWALIKQPGRYEVAGEYTASFSTNTATVRSAPISLTVLPRTPQEMSGYISELTNRIAALPRGGDYHGQIGPTPELDNLVMKLMFTCSPKKVPTLLDCMYRPGHSGFWECEALLYYVPRSSELKQTILAKAAERGLASNMQNLLSTYGCSAEEMHPLIERSLAPDNAQSWTCGALAAQQYASDAFTPRLVALATAPGSTARVQAIYALAANRTDEGVKALKTLLNDDDPKIREATEQALRAAYCFRGIWRGRPMKPEDFDKEYQHPK